MMPPRISGLRGVAPTRRRMTADAAKPWRLSASVVILAPAQQQTVPCDYRVCFVKRTARASFMPSAFVFPGGAVDAHDAGSARALLRRPGGDSAIRVAAVREAFEESGVGIFTAAAKPIADVAAWRTRVHDDAASLTELCRAHGMAPAVDELSFWCSFITPDPEHQRLRKGGFDARFYVWCAGPDAGDLARATQDNTETVALAWLTPHEALAEAAAGRISMAPPQWYIIHELATRCPCIAGVPAYAASAARTLSREYPIKPYLLTLSDSERAELKRARAIDAGSDADVLAMAYPGDERHPVYPGPHGARHRMTMTRSLGKSWGDMQLELSNGIPLPLSAKVEGWYSVAKL